MILCLHNFNFCGRLEIWNWISETLNKENIYVAIPVITIQILIFDNMIEEDNKTIWCGNLAEQVTEELLYELFLQVCIFTKASSNVS